MNSQNFFNIISTIASSKYRVIIRIMLEQKERDFYQNELLEYCSIEDIIKLLNLNILKPSTLNENNNLYKLNHNIIDFAKKMEDKITIDISSNKLLTKIDENFKELKENSNNSDILNIQDDLVALIEEIDNNFHNNIGFYKNSLNKEYKAIKKTEVKYKNLTKIMIKIDDFMKELQTFQNILENYRYIYNNKSELARLKTLIQNKIYNSNNYIYLDIGKIAADVNKYINKFRKQSLLVEKIQNFLKIDFKNQKKLIDKHKVIIDPIQINGLLLNENDENIMLEIQNFKKELKLKTKHIKSEDRIINNQNIEQEKVVEKVFRLANIHQKFLEYSENIFNTTGEIIDLISFLEKKLNEHNLQKYKIISYYIELVQRYGNTYNIKDNEFIEVEYKSLGGKNRIVKVPAVFALSRKI